MTALDIRSMWPYFDPIEYPNKVDVRLGREIFSPLYGSHFDKTRPVPSSLGNLAEPTGKISSIKVRHYQFIDGMTITYEGSSSPVKIGGNGGKEDEIYLGDDSIRTVVCEYANAIAALNFITVKNGPIGRMGDYGGGKHLIEAVISYPEHILSSIHGFGTAPGYGNVLSGCVFGFQLVNKTRKDLSLGTIRKLAENAPARFLPMLLE